MPQSDPRIPVQEPVKPVLRGWLHLVCFVISLPAGVIVVAGAGPARSRAAAIVYAIGCCALFGVSSAYHRGRWSPQAKARMQRLDHGTIFVMIAGCYTPMCLVALHGATGIVMLAGAWTGAAIGFTFALTGIAEKKLVGLLCYIGLGWFMVLVTPQLAARLTTAEFVLVVAGGVIYTVGGVGLATRWPDPFPRVFGYHEVWHTMVALAFGCQYVAISTVLHSA